MIGVHPSGLTMRELVWMAHGKAELLGGTTGSRQTVEPWNPALLQEWIN